MPSPNARRLNTRGAADAADRLSRRGALVRGGLSLATALAGASIATATTARQATPAATEPGAFSSEEQLALETIVAARLGGQRVPGAVVGVSIPGRGSWVHAQGIADLGAAAPIATDDHFRIASVSKTFTATLVLQLVDAGKLTLDDTLEQYIPGIPNGSEITIRQLWQMTAGIYDFTLDEQFMAAYDRDPLVLYTPDDVIAIVARHEPDFAPGTSLSYSDTNYTLLGMIVEQVTGESFAQALQDLIATPLGLTETSKPDTPEMPEPFARGYIATSATDDTLRDVTASNPLTAWSAGGMISTVADLQVWAVALGEGTLLTPQT